MEKRSMKSALALVLALVMCLTCFVGCNTEKPVETQPKETQGTNKPAETTTPAVESNYPDYLNLDGYRPIVKEGEQITLKVAVLNHPSQEVPVEETWFVKFLEEKMNVKLEIENIENASANDRKSLMFSSGDLPDMMLVFGLKATDLTQYGVEDELLLPINEYMDETLTPNLIAHFESDSTATEAFTSPDGNIYGVPQLYGEAFGSSSTIPHGYRIFVDTKYMDAAGYETLPDTLDGFVDMLRAFKDVGDELGVDTVYPLMGLDQQYRHIIKSAFGWMHLLGDDDVLPVWDVEEGKIVIPATQEKYKEYVTLMNTLYTEGLLHPDCFSVDRNTAKAIMAEGKVGVLNVDAPFVIAPNTWSDYIAHTPLKSEHNPEGYLKASFSYGSSYVSISADTEYPELCMRLLDYLCSPEGYVYNAIGAPKGSEDTLGLIEGYTIVNNTIDFGSQDDNYETVIAYKVNNINLSWQYMVNEDYFLPYACELAGITYEPTGLDPENNSDHHYKYELATACEGKLLSAIPNIVVPAEDNARYTDLKTALTNYVKQEYAKFVVGQRPLSELDAFQKELEAMGMAEYIELCEKAYANVVAPSLVH